MYNIGMGKQKEDGTIRFEATVKQVKTLVDGGIVASFDLPEGEIDTAAALMECQAKKMLVAVVLLPVSKNAS